MKKENFIKILKNIKSNFFIFKKNYLNYFLGEDIRNNKLIKKNFDKYKNTYFDLIIKNKEKVKSSIYKIIKKDFKKSIKYFEYKNVIFYLKNFSIKTNNFFQEKLITKFKSNSDKENIDPNLTLLPPPPIWSRVFIWTLGSGSVTLILWSIFTTVEETIILTGELTTITPEVKISARDPGRIKEVLVKLNQYVDKNTILMIYEDDETKDRLNSAKKRFEFSQNQRINLMDAYDIKLKQLNYQIKFKEDIAARYKSLLKEGAVSELRYLESLTELEQLKNNYESALIEKDNSLYQNSEQLEQISTQIFELKAKINRFKIVSPVSGFIQNIKYQSPGERIMANDVVITVVPDNELIVKALIPSRVRAPIQSGMEAIVEVDAFPSDDFGGIIAEVFTISPTVSTDNTSGSTRRTFIAEIKLISPELPGKFSFDELRSGMAISTKIKLRDKPIIASAFSIISDIFDPLAEER